MPPRPSLVRWLATTCLMILPVPLFFLMDWAARHYPVVQRWERFYSPFGALLFIGAPLVFLWAGGRLVRRIKLPSASTQREAWWHIVGLALVCLAYGGFCLWFLLALRQFAAEWGGYRG